MRQGSFRKWLWVAALTILLAPLHPTRAAGAPTPLSPSGTISDDTPTYNWTAVAGALRYTVAAYDKTAGAYATVTSPSGTGTSYTATTPLDTTHDYKWKVRARTAAGWGGYSRWLHFDIDDPIGDLEARISALELQMRNTALAFAGVSRQGSTLVLAGMNVQIVDGTGDTGGAPNGLGNLIVGYGEADSGDLRTGSHNLVVGPYHSYDGVAGFVAGYDNNLLADYASVSGGSGNTASGGYSSVGGGYGNEASGDTDWIATGCPDDMVEVGKLCVDKYEASVWSSPTGGTQYGASTDDYPCNDNGQNCTGASTIYALSVAGVTPSVWIAWFQAEQACASAGKRLLTNEEWQRAVTGTPDGAPCIVDAGGPGATGTTGCVSSWGAFDMVGNVSEWVADWVARSTACPHWGSFSDDWMCLSGASTSANGPSALRRGGWWRSGTTAGPFNVRGGGEPWLSGYGVGFRCAR